jgi:uncharacterized protein (TIGR03435 family)
MRRAMMGAGLVILSCCAAFAQGAGTQPSFEVASIKPAAPPTDGRLMVRLRGGPGTPDPGQITYTNVNIKMLMTSAYNVKGYQISGPDWLDSQRFDITAKLPPDTTKEQFQLMLQNLLAERFKLTLHHQTKELPMYALVVAKGGPKMKESVDDPNAATAGGPNAGGPDGRGGAFGGVAGGRLPMGKDGFPELPKGAAGRGMIMMGMNGRMRMSANGQTIAQLAETLSNQLSRPVTDMTELTAKYDYTLDFSPDDGQTGAMMKGLPMPMHQGGEGAVGPMATPDGSSGPTIFSAVQEQLGLKLEARKGAVDMLVIDTLEKVPTEN